MITAARTASKQVSADDSVVGLYLRSRTKRNRDRVVEAYYPIVGPLVSRIGRCARQRVVDEDDLMQAGAIALVNAVETYDPARSSFRSHAYYRVKFAILEEIRQATGRARSPVESLDDRDLESRSLMEGVGFVEMLDECREHLTDQQICVLVCHYYNGISISDIRVVLGINWSRVTKLHQSALDTVASVMLN